MKKSSFIINQILFLIIFIFIGCSTGGYSPQNSSNNFKSATKNEQVEQGLNLINDVYGLVINNYVDPVPPYKLLIETVKGIENKVGNTNLLFKGTETDVVMSPITQTPYDTGISVEETRNAFFEIYRYIVNKYPNYSPIELSSTLLNGMLHGLDSHNSLLSPDDFTELQIDTKGKFTGVGVSITMKDGFVTVISPIEGTSAYKAGIKTGDRIIKVNGEATRDLREAVKMIRGHKGTEVVVSITREESKKPIEFNLVRGIIPVESVKATVLKPGYGYIRVTNFRDNTTKDLITALEKLESGKTRLTGLILDLRNNPGGLLNQAIKVSDLFIENGIILSIKGRWKKYPSIYKATTNKVKRNYPIVLLINGGSASSSEIVAGALQDQKRALILGTTSFGKGSVQSVEKLRNGCGLKLTIARYYTPSGRSIQTKGIEPDIEDQNITTTGVRNDKAKPFEGEYRLEPYMPKTLLSDNQVKQAFKILQRSYYASVPEMIKIAKEKTMEKEQTLLVGGENSKFKKHEEIQSIGSMASPKLKPRLFVLSVGVSQYKDSKLNLAFAKDDAEVLAETFQNQPNKIFREVRTKIMTDETATRENILEAMTSFLGRAVSTDVVIIFIAGHGIKRLSTGTFYFLPLSSYTKYSHHARSPMV
jgi:C-terminal peptidase prc